MKKFKKNPKMKTKQKKKDIEKTGPPTGMCTTTD